MLLVFINSAFKLSLAKWRTLVATTLACVLWIGLNWPSAIGQSQNQIEEWLADQKMMLDASVILTVEVLWQISYCMLAGKHLYGERDNINFEDARRGKFAKFCYSALNVLPGILIFPVLYYLLVQVIYLFPGYSFSAVAWSLAFVVGIVLLVLALGIRWLLPERELRLEMLFLDSSLIMILGVIATMNGTATFSASDPVEWSALAVFLALLLVCALTGFTLYTKGKKQVFSLEEIDEK